MPRPEKETKNSIKSNKSLGTNICKKHTEYAFRYKVYLPLLELLFKYPDIKKRNLNIIIIYNKLILDDVFWWDHRKFILQKEKRIVWCVQAATARKKRQKIINLRLSFDTVVSTLSILAHFLKKPKRKKEKKKKR